MKRNKIIKLAMLILPLSLILILIGTSLAFFNYAKNGNSLSSITAGSITMHYKEIDGIGHGIGIIDALPVASNTTAKSSDNYFRFNITGSTTKNDVVYTVTTKMTDGSDLVMGNIVDLYLTEVKDLDGTLKEDPTPLFNKEIPPKFNELKQTTRVDESEAIEKVIYTDTITPASGNYNKNFRLRMWIDQDANFGKDCSLNPIINNTQEKCTTAGGTWDYQYNNKSFSITINVNTYEEPALLTNGGLIERNGNYIKWNQLEDLGITKEKVTGEVWDIPREEYIATILKNNNLNGTLVLPNDIERVDGLDFVELDSIIIPDSTKYVSVMEAKLNYLKIPQNVETFSSDAYIKEIELDSPYIDSLITESEKLIIGEHVETIEDEAFIMMSSKLKEVEIIGNIKSIGEAAFNDDTSGECNIEAINFPDSLETIGAYAFRDCDKLNFDKLSSSLKEIGREAFYRNYSLTLNSLPNSLIKIGPEAFYDCKELSIEKLHNNIKEIGFSAFQGCTNLKISSIPESVTKLEEYAFDYTGITSMEIKSNIDTLDISVFSNCENLKSISINAKKITDDYGNYLSEGLENVTIGSNVDLTNSINPIGGHTLKKLYLNANIIPDDMQMCAENVVINNATRIGDNAFSDCGNLKTVSIPDTVTSIGNSAFSYTGLTTVILPPSLTRIESSTFRDTNLTTVTMGNNVTYIGPEAFYNNNYLTTINLSNSLVEIGDEAFYYCESIQNLVLPNSLRKVGSEAFYNVDFGDNYTIPTGITNLKPYAFSGDIKISPSDIDNWIIGDKTYNQLKQEENNEDLTPDNIYNFYGYLEWTKSNQ